MLIWWFIRRFDLSFSLVTFICRILSFYCVTLSVAISSFIYQRHHIMSFASVMFLSHSLLESSFDILNLTCIVFSVTIYIYIYCRYFCVTLLSCAFVIFSRHPLCQLAICNRCAYLLLSCCSVVFSVVASVVRFFVLVMFLCHCLL